jgi:hypothetical protein
MSRLPEVLRQYPQPTTVGGPKAELKAREATLPPRAIPAMQEVGFFAHTIQGEAKTFTVLAGEGAAVPTEGWVKLQKVTRFQRASLTVPEGYDPYVLTVPIMFDAIALAKNRPNVEEDIETLEWMAGRAAHGEPVGPPPQVSVYSTDSNGNLTSLIPKQFQTVHGSSQQWYLGPIAFDANPLKASRAVAQQRGITPGDRLRQLATVTLTEIVVTSSAIQEERKAREEVKGKFKTVYTTGTVNTIRRVALSVGSPESWNEILAANQNVTTNPDRTLRNHTKIKVPLAVYRQVAR